MYWGPRQCLKPTTKQLGMYKHCKKIKDKTVIFLQEILSSKWAIPENNKVSAGSLAVRSSYQTHYLSYIPPVTRKKKKVKGLQT